MVDHYPADNREKEITHAVDTEPLDYASARIQYDGYFEPSPEKPETGKALPGKPLTYPKPGYVHDTHERRAEQGEFKAVPQTRAEERIFLDALNKSHAEADFDWLVELQEQYLDDKIDIKTATARLTAKFGAEALEIAAELFGDGKYKSSVIRLSERPADDF